MILSINQENPHTRHINQVTECLRQGGVIIYPTDTTYGLGCDIFNRKGVKKIFQIKQRDSRKPFSFIFVHNLGNQMLHLCLKYSYFI